MAPIATPLHTFFNALSPLSGETWAAMEPLFRRKEMAEQEYFAKQHEVATELAFLETGCVRAFFTNAEGKEYNKQFFVGPSLIGAYTALLTGQPNLIPQQALTPCVLWAAPFAPIKALFNRHHDLERLARVIAEHYFLEKERKELEMALDNATQRYLRFRQQFPTLEQQIPQYHIASYLGISATQLSRIRKAMASGQGPAPLG